MTTLEKLALDLGVHSVTAYVTGHPKFPLWAGAAHEGNHHCRKGGLMEHTTEVAELCLLNNKYFPTEKQSDPRLLFVAAVYHDVGKIWDYQPGPSTIAGVEFDYSKWSGTQHKRRIHHISRSALVWMEQSKNSMFSEEEREDVLHAILAHHGMREWGSPVAPATRLAWLLHLCDGISARLDDATTRDRF